MCPPWVDQTHRMHQRWSIIIPRLRLQLPIDTIRERCSSSKPFFFDFPKNFMFLDNNHFNFWTLFLNPLSSTDDPPVRSVRSSRSHNASSFSKLPSEIIFQIIENLAPEDAICLGMANDHLWVHILQSVRSTTQRIIGRLAGQEVALTGNYLTALPEAFEHNALLRRATDYTTPTEGSYRSRWNQPRMMNYAALNKFPILDSGSPQQIWSNAFGNVCQKFSLASTHCSEQSEELNQHTSVLSETDWMQSWIFRNLTTREYICIKLYKRDTRDDSATCDSKLGYLDCGETGDIRIDHVFLVQTYWTDAPEDEEVEEESPAIDYGFKNGEWAGHKFDIVRRDMSDVDNFEAGWSDVSKEVVEKISNVIKKWRTMDKVLREAFQQAPDDLLTSFPEY